jgi:hypothetical protein
VKQQTFKSVDDILRHYGWEAPIKVVEVRKDEGSANRSQTLRTAGENRKPERDADGDTETSVSNELRHSD